MPKTSLAIPAMTSPSPSGHNPMSDSSLTIPSDSENYEANNELSSSPRDSSPSNSPVILYSPPTIWSLLRGAAINLVLPFINGLMLGFGELLAHEVAFRFGWSGTKVCCCLHSIYNTDFLRRFIYSSDCAVYSRSLWLLCLFRTRSPSKPSRCFSYTRANHRTHRYSPDIGAQGRSVRAWRCGAIRWRGDGETARSLPSIPA